MSLLDKIKSAFRFNNLDRVRRSCWIPVVEKGDGGPTASKFSGIPYFSSGEEWPICPNCNNPIQLFLQLNSDELPEECRDLWGDALLQFFYCTNTSPMCDVDCQAFYPFARSTVLRVVPVKGESSWKLGDPVAGSFPPKRIVGWRRKTDYPNWEELKESGIELPEDQLEKLAETYPHGGEKLLGWPLWVQGIEYPNCPKCVRRMQLLFQIDSEQNIPYMFGDVGCGHISQCPVHRTELAFGWACS